jgi:hypothetical protein
MTITQAWHVQADQLYRQAQSLKSDLDKADRAAGAAYDNNDGSEAGYAAIRARREDARRAFDAFSSACEDYADHVGRDYVAVTLDFFDSILE